MGATRNTGYLENLIQYDASDNVAIATSVNPSYKVTLGGSMLGTSAVFSSTITSSNEFRGLNGYGIRSYTAATATGNNILFAASVFASFDGIYQSSGSTNDFGIWTNGGTINQPKFVIKNGGNVGIGTTSPNKGGVNRALTLNAATSTNASYELSVNDILQGSLYTTISDTSVRLANFNSGDIVFVTGASSTERMRITSAGDMYLTGRSTNGDYGMYFYSNDTDSRIYSSNSGAVSKSLIFYTSGTERLRIRSGGEVSFIPTTWTYVNPNTTYRNMDIGAAGFLYRDATDAYLLSNHYYNSSGQNIAKYTYSEGIGAFAFAGGNLTWYSYGASVTAGSAYATTPRFTVTYTGNVGIGTTSPDTYSYGGSRSFLTFRANGTNQEPFLQLIADGTGNSLIDFGNATIRRATIIGFDGSHLAFFTNGSNSGTTTNERMRITSGGYSKHSNDGTYLGSTTAYHEFRQTALNDTLVMNATNASFNYSNIVSNITRSTSTAYNHIYALTGSGQVFYVRGDGNVYNANGVFASQSDIKLKENIIDATPKLSDILKVKVRNYNLIGNSEKHIGVIAQELEEIFPNLVEVNQDRDSDGKLLETTTKSVKYSVFVPMLIKAIQELNQKIQALENR